AAPTLAPEELARMEKLFQRQQHLTPATQDERAHWAHEFTHIHSEKLMSRSNEPSSTTLYNRPPSFGVGLDSFLSSTRLGSFGFGYGAESHFPPMFNSSTAQVEQNQQGKLVELSDENWEAEFARVGLEPSTKPDAQSEIISASIMNDPETVENFESSELAATDVEDNEADAEFLKSLENTWKNLASNLNTASLLDSDLAGWEREFGTLNDSDQFPNMAFTPENVGDFLKEPRPYPYQPDNVFMDHPDPFEEGRRLIASGAPLSQAALAFEAACQLDESRGEAWRILGETHAADEKEHLAIKAFEKAVGCGGVDGQASWMSLAIAWVNEGHELRALATLERWLGDTYPDVAATVHAAQREPTHNPWDRHSRVVDMFLAAARAGPNAREGPGKDVVRSQIVDADVQVGLGVLFYSNSDYDRARDCFEAALGVNPGDFLLWNRLGATLANGGQPEDAIDAYRRALELRPTFTRAIYNLGVSCLNIRCFKEAAEHLLAALSLHRKSGETNVPGISDVHPLLPDGDGSDNLWHTLRRAFLCLERQDLADRAIPGADVDSFRLEGFDF
ncbi:hypothetical protein CROQUDRAFT_44809, partial [Cronartium quercuum f. sp. fusiforme G11]